MGRESAFQNYMKTLESDTSFIQEKDSLKSTLNKYLRNKKWKEAESLTLRYLPYFPRFEFMYETLILARRGLKSPLLEEAYTLTCVIFKEETRYFVRYGVYLQENKKYIEALSAFRRAYLNSLRFKQNEDWDEILFLLRQTYTNLGREKDALAIDLLVTDTRRKDQLDPKNLQQHISTFRKNREFLLLGIYFFREKNSDLVNQYKADLALRDKENEYQELLFVIGPFALESKELD